MFIINLRSSQILGLSPYRASSGAPPLCLLYGCTPVSCALHVQEFGKPGREKAVRKRSGMISQISLEISHVEDNDAVPMTSLVLFTSPSERAAGLAEAEPQESLQ